jgi:hypothetical protein
MTRRGFSPIRVPFYGCIFLCVDGGILCPELHVSLTQQAPPSAQVIASCMLDFSQSFDPAEDPDGSGIATQFQKDRTAASLELGCLD